MCNSQIWNQNRRIISTSLIKVVRKKYKMFWEIHLCSSAACHRRLEMRTKFCLTTYLSSWTDKTCYLFFDHNSKIGTYYALHLRNKTYLEKKIFVPLMAHVPQKQMSLVKVTKEIVRAHTSFLQFSRDSGSLIESLVSMAKLVLLCTTTNFLHIMDSKQLWVSWVPPRLHSSYPTHNTCMYSSHRPIFILINTDWGRLRSGISCAHLAWTWSTSICIY